MEALERQLGSEADSADPESSSARGTPPKVRVSELAKYPDSLALRRAFPNGYRIVGPLIPSDDDPRPIRADRVAEEATRMDQEELEDQNVRPEPPLRPESGLIIATTDNARLQELKRRTEGTDDSLGIPFCGSNHEPAGFQRGKGF